MQNSYIIRGNEENYLDYLSAQDKSSWTDGQLCTLYWSYNTLTKENRQYLSNLPKQICFMDGNININISHSSENFIGILSIKSFQVPKPQ